MICKLIDGEAGKQKNEKKREKGNEKEQKIEEYVQEKDECFLLNICLLKNNMDRKEKSLT